MGRPVCGAHGLGYRPKHQLSAKASRWGGLARTSVPTVVGSRAGVFHSLLTPYRFEPRIPRGRHTGTDGRYPDHREVAQTAIHGDWVPAIPAGTTGLRELI
ncbi:MAG: hypothetical protein ACFCVA_11510 [Gammaproteobacteria bacterium]